MSTTPAKALAQRKATRQKQILAVASVVLLAVVGFQLSKVLGGGTDSAAAPGGTTTAPSLTSPLAAAPAKLPDTDRIVVQHDSDQLLSFGLFKSKDPFVQQLSGSSAVSPSSPQTTPIATVAAPRVAPPSKVGVGLTPAPTPTTPASTVPSTSTTPAPTTPATTSPSTTPAAPATAPTSVSISTNGVCLAVALNGTFPTSEDIFRLVSIAPDGKSVKIGVVGGAYDSGQATATLKLGDKLTLVNTADGTRYVIALLAKCPVQTTPPSAAPTTPAVTTTTPSTPTTPAPTTTTTTTPIVTDPLDTTTTQTPFG